MKYMGSKNRIAKYLLPIILADRSEDQYYVEPFCGGLGTMDKVYGKRIASDNNKYLIAMWKGLQAGEARPAHISKELYNIAREEYNGGTNVQMDDFMIGWIGFMASFNGRFFDGGYSGCAGNRNYVSEQIRNTERQIHKLEGIEFVHASYDRMSYPDNSIIYCDIPYYNTTQYASSSGFNHYAFWKWAASMKGAGHSIFVSEYAAPSGIECVWQMEVTNSLNTSKTYRPIEKLFKI